MGGQAARIGVMAAIAGAGSAEPRLNAAGWRAKRRDELFGRSLTVNILRSQQALPEFAAVAFFRVTLHDGGSRIIDNIEYLLAQVIVLDALHRMQQILISLLYQF